MRNDSRSLIVWLAIIAIGVYLLLAIKYAGDGQQLIRNSKPGEQPTVVWPDDAPTTQPSTQPTTAPVIQRK
jgi:hypothetical protein